MQAILFQVEQTFHSDFITGFVTERLLTCVEYSIGKEAKNMFNSVSK
jgi:hypothetical protein